MTLEFLGFTLLLHEHFGYEAGPKKVRFGRCWGVIIGDRAFMLIFSVIDTESLEISKVNSENSG